MLPEKAFLRHLPTVLSLQQRWGLEALVYASDVTEYSFERMRQVTREYGSDLNAIRPADKIALFTHAWSIVDQIHVVNQLLPSIFDSQTATKDLLQHIDNFCKKFEVASLLRNKMDHLRANIPNLSKKKSVMPPLFGAISYFWVGVGDVTNVDGRGVITAGNIITITAGSTLPTSAYLVVNPMGQPIKLPVGLFHLHAFDYKFSLEEANTELHSLIEKIDKIINVNLEKQIEEISLEKKVAKEDLMRSAPDSVMLSMRVEFDSSKTIK